MLRSVRGFVLAVVVGFLVAVVGLLFSPSTNLTPAWATGESWTLVEGVITETQSVAYGDGVWVAVSDLGTNRVMRSTDGGVTWSAVAVPTTQSWKSVAYGDGVWVAVAPNGGQSPVMRSEDGGETWSAVAVPDASNWFSVAYGDGVWVAVAAGTQIGNSNQDLVMRSEDGGETWSAVEAAASNRWFSVAYGDGVWVAVSDDGTNRVMRSEDGGETWSGVAAPGTNDWSSVAYGDGVWVAVERGRGNFDQVMRSEDGGETWSGVAAPESRTWSSVAFGNGVWVAVAGDGVNQVMRSTDRGVTWSSADAPLNNFWSSVAYGDGVWVAVADDSRAGVMRSLDPLTPPAVSNPVEKPMGDPGIYLYVAGSEGDVVPGTAIHHGSFAVAPNSPYSLTLEPRVSGVASKTVLASGVTSSGGHMEDVAQMGALAPGSYKIVMSGIDRSGIRLTLTNHVTVDAAGHFVSLSPESLQPTLR